MDSTARIPLGVGLAAGSIWAMSSIIGPASPYSWVAWAALWLILLFGLLLMFWPYIKWPTRRARVNWYLIVAAVGGLICVVALIGYFIDKSKGPIAWEFDDGKPPFGVSRRSGEALWIDAIQVTGQNRTDDPAVIQEAYIRSDRTNRTIRLQYLINGVSIPLREASVIPHGSFVLISILPSTDRSRSQGIGIDAFREEFRAFSFTYDCNGQKVVRHFAPPAVDAFLDRADLETRNALSNANEMMRGPGSGAVRNPNP